MLKNPEKAKPQGNTDPIVVNTVNWKAVLLLTIVFAVLTLGVVWFFRLQDQANYRASDSFLKKTASSSVGIKLVKEQSGQKGWVRYIDNKNKFSVEAPDNYFLMDTSTVNGFIISQGKDERGENAGNIRIVITILGNSSESEINKKLGRVVGSEEEAKGAVSIIAEKTSIDGFTAIREVFEPEEGYPADGGYNEVYYVKGPVLLQIQLTSPKNNSDRKSATEYFEIGDKIAKSVKFLD